MISMCSVGECNSFKHRAQKRRVQLPKRLAVAIPPSKLNSWGRGSTPLVPWAAIDSSARGKRIIMEEAPLESQRGRAALTQPSDSPPSMAKATRGQPITALV